MSCQHLVCASCMGPVAEGRCPTCRAARDERHSHGVHVSTQMMLLLAALLSVALLLALRVTG